MLILILLGFWTAAATGRWRPQKQSIFSLSMCLVLSRVQLFGTLWTVTSQAPLLMGFSRQEYWSRMPFPSPLDLSPTQGSILCLLGLLHCRQIP